jgi:hypothetical protein
MQLCWKWKASVVNHTGVHFHFITTFRGIKLLRLSLAQRFNRHRDVNFADPIWLVSQLECWIHFSQCEM